MKIEKNVLLKNYTTFKIGGPAKFFAKVSSLEELEEAISWAREKKERHYVLGGGSNVLFLDSGFDGLVIRLENDFIAKEEKEGKIIVKVGAGTSLAKLVDFAAKEGLTGLEWATGIPGTVGGAVVGNAGAFGKEMKDLVKRVEAVFWEKEDSLERRIFNNEQCQFGYRKSFFKSNKKAIVWEVQLEFLLGNKEEIKKEMESVLRKRKEKQPSLAQFPSAGSIFKNPEVPQWIIELFENDKEIKCKDKRVPAGWIIERCRLKGKRVGGAMFSPLQANFIVNCGNATAEDVIILISFAKVRARNFFKIRLYEEIEIVF